MRETKQHLCASGGRWPVSRSMLANTSACHAEIMPEARRGCLRACPVLWLRFRKIKPLVPKCAPLVALFCHSLEARAFGVGGTAKKGQQRCPILRKLPEFLITYKPKMIAAKAHRKFGR